MAGGVGEQGLQDSILETPVYVLAFVFFCFMALSIMFEYIVHFLQHLCQHKGRPGMADAVNKIVMELTLLGFVSLLLQTFSSPLGKMCVDYSPTMESWTWLSNLQGCPCCLAHTNSVSICAEMHHDCLYNVTSRQPFCGCEVTGSQAYIDSGGDTSAFVASGQLDDTCQPYELSELQFYIDVSTNALASLADLLGMSEGEMCALLGKNDTDYTVTATTEDEAYDINSNWESSFRRRRLLAGDGEGGDGGAITNPLAVILSNLERNYSGPGASPTTVHILPRVKLFKCTGSFMSSACPPGKVLLISANSLHQVHIWLFLIATFHVAVSMFQMAGAELLVRCLWRRWERQAQLQEAAGGAAAARLEPCASDMELGSAGKDAPAPAPAPAPAEPGAEAVVAAGAAAAGCAAAVAAGVRTLRRRWRYRKLQRHGAHGMALEAAICCMRSLSPLMVTRSTFLVMRAAWLSGMPQPAAAGGEVQEQPSSPGDAAGSSSGGGHKGGVVPAGAAAAAVEGQPPPDFVSHVLECLDHDMPALVGLSVEMGLVIVVIVLLTGAFGWAGSLVMLVAALMLLATNIALVALLRHSCRGGRPHPAKHRSKWWRRPSLLLGIPIRLLLFLVSYVFSTTTLLAWQFGTDSCFFDATADSWGNWALQHWVGLTMASVFLLWMSAATIPAFALAVHTHTRLPPRGAHGTPDASTHSGSQPMQLVPAWAGGGGGCLGGGAEAAGAEAGGGGPAQELRAEAQWLRARLAVVEASLAVQEAAAASPPAANGGGSGAKAHEA